MIITKNKRKINIENVIYETCNFPSSKLRISFSQIELEAKAIGAINFRIRRQLHHQEQQLQHQHQISESDF
jgi:hypothetical protein